VIAAAGRVARALVSLLLCAVVLWAYDRWPAATVIATVVAFAAAADPETARRIEQARQAAAV
jgi:hypothetical protein